MKVEIAVTVKRTGAVIELTELRKVPESVVRGVINILENELVERQPRWVCGRKADTLLIEER